MTHPTFGLSLHALDALGSCHWNTHTTALVEMALSRGEGHLTQDGALAIDRRPGSTQPTAPAVDRLIVQGMESGPEIAWTAQNRPLDSRLFSHLFDRLQAYLQDRELFIQDRGLGAHDSRLTRVRVITNRASHALLARHLLREIPDDAQNPFFPDVTFFFVPDFKPHPSADQLPGSAAAILDIDNRVGLIVGTASIDELPRLLERLVSFDLPEEQRLPLMGTALQNRFTEDVILLLGRDGVGTTRLGLKMCLDNENLEIIGDGALSISEGGLDILGNGSVSAFSDVFDELQKTFGLLVEAKGGSLDLASRQLLDAQGARIAWPRSALPPQRPRKVAPAPRHVFLVVRDDSGALPPLARIDHATATQFFALGPGVCASMNQLALEPRIDFEDCLDASRVIRPRAVYERLFAGKLARHAIQTWLINSGRVLHDTGSATEQPVETTSLLALAAIEGDLNESSFRQDSLFGLEIPTACEGLSAREIDPIGQLKTRDVYEQHARRLVEAMTARGFVSSNAREDR
ncbi:MAG: phosphoenolpyruvate carboxykinase (ATP) [Myxococcales bacterium]|jgi:phosphoenolpyruvate carboxykinase (ATP)|nr:phosphoenolpyruvate carboxykinase (ATP) [Myxococcales bacterium]